VKREPPTHHLRQTAKRFWPWLCWWPCLVCGKEFRREYGWKWQRGVYGDYSESEAVCAECCPTEVEAYAVFASTPSGLAKARAAISTLATVDNDD
jgi:hypothetical protein